MTRQVMLVAGGSGSIGGAVARAAAHAGWAVALHGRDAARLPALLPPGDHAAFAEDLLPADAAARLVRHVGERFGRIDAVVDCVSTAPDGIVGPFAGTDPAAYAALADVTPALFQRLAHAALPWLARQGGTLVALSSDAGRFAAPGQSLIGASRGATMAFVRNLAVEVARDGVRVHCVAPSYVAASRSFEHTAARSSARIEKARRRAGLGLPTPDDIAPLILFLCGEGARRITGQVISVNGGLNA